MSVISAETSCLRICSAAVVPAKPFPTMTYRREPELLTRTPFKSSRFWVSLEKREGRPLDVRLVQLLGSFITARNQYALARLEYAMRHDGSAAPPVIDRVTEASEAVLAGDWPRIESQLAAAVVFARRFEGRPGTTSRADESARFVVRTIRELDQYARAIRWVLTVTQSEDV